MYRLTASIKRIITGKLANKLILVLLPSVTVFIILLILIAYTRTTDILRTDFIENNKNILKLVVQNFDNYMEQVDEFSLTPRMDVAGTFMKLLPLEEYSYENDRYIDEQMINMFNSRQDVEEMSLYIPTAGRGKHISRTFPKIRNSSNADYSNEQWYKEATQGIYYRWIETAPIGTGTASTENKNKVFITFYRALINIPDQKPLGIIAISLNYSQMNKMVRQEYIQNGEVLCIFDKDNKLMYQSNGGISSASSAGNLFKYESSNALSGNFNVEMDGNEYLAVYTASDNSKWKAVKLIPVNILNEKVRETRNISLLLGILFIFIFTSLIIFESKVITNSLRRLSRQMDKVGEGNFKTKAVVRGNDEIAHLARKFNDMVEQVDVLINERYMAQINEKTARLKALEAQVNPHFIYNSLQAISTKAVMSRRKDISRMTEALAHNLRYCIKGGDMVRISDEINHVDNYLILHKARFEDRLSVEIVVEEGISDIVVPKLSIHTLVENSIKHSLEMMTGSILIRIHAYAGEDHVTISVADNGPGMTPERLKQVIAETEDPQWLEKPGESIGLKNLNARLKLLYGDKAYLVIDSNHQMGTVIKIVLPSMKNS